MNRAELLHRLTRLDELIPKAKQRYQISLAVRMQYELNPDSLLCFDISKHLERMEMLTEMCDRLELYRYKTNQALCQLN